MGYLVWLILIIVRLPIGALLSGWVISNYWNWFLYQKIDGFQSISFKVAMGLGLILGMIGDLVRNHSTNQKGKDKSVGENIIEACFNMLHVTLLCLISVGMGWVFHQFLK